MPNRIFMMIIWKKKQQKCSAFNFAHDIISCVPHSKGNFSGYIGCSVILPL